MQRRRFLTQMALAIGAGLGSARTGHSAAVTTRSIAQLYCAGGPDFRHLFAPEYSDHSDQYGYHYWKSRASSFNSNSSASALKTLSESFQSFDNGQGGSFGINSKADWLAAEFEAGRVAIINNVYGTRSRNHEHATKVFESGHHWVLPENRQVSGWGGRLAQQKGERILSLTSNVRTFCYGAHASDPLMHDNQSVLSMSNSRNWGLYKPEILSEEPAKLGYSNATSRALENYYRAKRLELSAGSPYRIFMQHEEKFRELGDAIKARLNTFTATPFATWENNTNKLNNENFQNQLTSLFDSLLFHDILNASLMSLDYGGFDTHKNQNNMLNTRFADMFGTGGGLDLFFAALREHQPTIADDFIMVIGGEFGRQLVANGDGGTDHGRGNSVILIGEPIHGGVYGNMFPDSEIENYSKLGKDIEGLTHVDRIFSKLSDWSKPNSSSLIFSGLESSDLESNEVLGFI